MCNLCSSVPPVPLQRGPVLWPLLLPWPGPQISDQQSSLVEEGQELKPFEAFVLLMSQQEYVTDQV